MNSLRAPLPKRVERANRREQEIAYILRQRRGRPNRGRMPQGSQDWREARDGCKGPRDESQRRLRRRHDRHSHLRLSVDCSGGRWDVLETRRADLVREEREQWRYDMQRYIEDMRGGMSGAGLRLVWPGAILGAETGSV